MKKMIFLQCLLWALFDISKSFPFKCDYRNDTYPIVGKTYFCVVQNYIYITLPETAYIGTVSGTHINGYNNDNIEAFQVVQQTVYYFPQRLNKVFKNLKGIHMHQTGLKEIHQTDLKVFPKLTLLYLGSNEIKVLEKGLFDYNPNLEYIDLYWNKISHIDSKVFDNLSKLWILYILNSCIYIHSYDDTTGLKDAIEATRIYCQNSEYLNLEQKVKNLELESDNLNSTILKEKLEILENEIKISNFSNFFQTELQNFRVMIDAKNETCAVLETRMFEILKILDDLTTEISNKTNDCVQTKKTDILHVDETCLGLNKTFLNLMENFDKADKNFIEKSSKIINDVAKNTENYASLNEIADIKLEILEEDLSDLKTFSYNKIGDIETKVKSAHFELVNTNKAIDRVERNLISKIDKIIKSLNIKV